MSLNINFSCTFYCVNKALGSDDLTSCDGYLTIEDSILSFTLVHENQQKDYMTFKIKSLKKAGSLLTVEDTNGLTWLFTPQEVNDELD